jgi:hypothetical protein
VTRYSANKATGSRCKGVTIGSTAEGNIVDYRALRMLVAEQVSEGAGTNVAVEVRETCGRPVVAVASEQRVDERFVLVVTIPLLGSRDPSLDKGAVGQHQTLHPDLLPE